MPREITIPKGATLSGLAEKYGTTVNELRVLNPNIKDPNKIFAGATLNLPTLAGTLEGGEEKTLPDQPIDRLSMFGDVLKMVTQRASKQAVAGGGKALPEGMLKPSQVSGGTFADVLGFVGKQKTRGIADIYTSTINFLEKQRKLATDQVALLINTNGLTQLNDEQITQLASASGMKFDHLMGIKSAQEKELKAPKSFSIVNRKDGKYRLGFDTAGNIISETKIAEAEEGDITSTWSKLTPTIKGDILSWVANQEGFDPSWIKKMDDDLEFSDFIISKYYQQLED